MKRILMSFCLVLLSVNAILAAAGSKALNVQRYGMVTGIKQEKIAYYKELHAKPWPAVNKKIKECNIRNYSIYLKQINGNYFLFSYFEYTGNNFAKDMAIMAADTMTQRWWKETDPCQVPLPAAAERKQIWTPIEEVFHTDGAAELPAVKVARLGTITGLKYEKEAWYRTLHQTPWPGVMNKIKEYRIRNYSIFLKEINAQLYLFSYFEYVGDDLAADGALMAKDDVTKRWWKETDPCQLPFPDALAKKQIWDGMEEVFHLD